jgi:uncharacterized iron-regulated protein
MLVSCIQDKAFAQSRQVVLDGRSLNPTSLEAFLAQVPRGSVVVIGENHGVSDHQIQQLLVLNTLKKLGHKVSVGLEFFESRHQPLVDQWRLGKLPEADFLRAIGWGSLSFDFYRPQAQFADLSTGERTIALNAPRELTQKVAKVGLNGLSDFERSLLPPHFEVGRQAYRERFLRLMPHLPNPQVGEQYFQAQSIWDDHMAWKASQFKQQYPQQTLVIIVGEFHVHYFGGLPDRLKLRGINLLYTISQIYADGLSDSEIRQMISYDQGEFRADLITF